MYKTLIALSIKRTINPLLTYNEIRDLQVDLTIRQTLKHFLENY